MDALGTAKGGCYAAEKKLRGKKGHTPILEAEGCFGDGCFGRGRRCWPQYFAAAEIVVKSRRGAARRLLAVASNTGKWRLQTLAAHAAVAPLLNALSNEPLIATSTSFHLHSNSLSFTLSLSLYIPRTQRDIHTAFSLCESITATNPCGLRPLRSILAPMSMASPPAAAAPAPMGPLPAAMFAYPDQSFARDAILAWYRGEFAAANAIIDALCNHLSQISRGSRPSGYGAVFNAIHRRRMNWIPVLHMQKYYPIADIALQLRAVAEQRRWAEEEPTVEKWVRGAPEEDGELKKVEAVVDVAEKTEKEVRGDEREEVAEVEKAEEVEEKEAVVAPEEEEEDEQKTSFDCGHSTEEEAKVSEEGIGSNAGSSHSQGEHSSVENLQICSDHEDCMTRPEKIKTCKGFMAKEHVKGHMVNVVKGLKMYEDIFKEEELSRLAEFINELRAAGRDGELSGDTFILFNQQLKGNKREIIQLGVPVFQSTKEEVASHIEPIPSILLNVIDHLVQWRLIPETRKPNSCIINFFDEGEHSQPYFKPPHLDNPISTLVLSETTMAFGRALVSDSHGNFRGSLTLPLKEGSLVVMRGNSADMARHVVCPSDTTRICITFLKVRPSRNHHQLDQSSPPAIAPQMSKAITLWKPESPPVQQQKALCYPSSDGVTPTWGVALQAAPILMLAPPRPVVVNPAARRVNRANGTGVFLPWTVGPKKYIRHLPPRIQRRRLHSLALPPPMDMQVEKASRIPCLAASGDSCLPM